MSGTLVTHGVGAVAAWLGVTPAAVSNWLARHWDEVPAPDAVIILPSGLEMYGWALSRKPEWEAFRDRARSADPRRRRVRRFQ